MITQVLTATAIKGLVSFNDDIAYHDACWRIKSTSNIINKDGYFSIFIPLKVILGFFEDYTKYIYRIHQELKLIRANTNCNNALLVDETIASAHTITISLSEIIWRMPQYKFSLTYEAEINKEISSSIEYEMYYRHWMYTEKSSILLEKHLLGTFQPHIINQGMSSLDSKKLEMIRSILIMVNMTYVILKMSKYISIIIFIILTVD